jgi:hypothetical protein
VINDEKNSGVTESRFALTLLICLLFAIGYVALLRLAGPKDTTNDTAREAMSVPYAGPGPAPLPEVEPQPSVLPLENPTDQISQRPKSVSPKSPAFNSERR